MKEYIEHDIDGNVLQHGDLVVTVVKNSRAKGGDLGFAFVHKPTIYTRARLIAKAEDLTAVNPYTPYGYYDRLQGKTYKITKD